MASNIIVRVQSAEQGTKRVQVKATERISVFLDKVREEFGLPNDGWQVYINREKTKELASTKGKTLTTYKIKHGDMLYLVAAMAASADVEMADSASASHLTSISSSFPSKRPTPSVTLKDEDEDDVDKVLWQQDGRIPQQRSEQLCRHGPVGKCFHCVPLEPYDENYLKSLDPPIKFISFHSHLRKLTGGVDRGKFVHLENISCKIKPGCKEHPPWPEGICTKCQPNAVTLNRQKYRHVDYIQFENPFLVEQFLNYWRRTGHQRVGYMYGRYEPYKDVPLGIKAVVAAIYEPPQMSTKNEVELLDDTQYTVVTNLARQLGLQRVGWIFTDLLPLDTTKGTVKHFRGTINSHFLSAEECITAATYQNKQPNHCKLSPDKHFGSKFVTVVVTGGDDNQIHFEGYQVSNQGMALVADSCLVPTVDIPELGYIKESSDQQYVPDVFYKEKDSYGNEVTALARPLPVEYLLVDMPAAFPVEPAFTFHAGHSTKAFPIENRSAIGDSQDFGAFMQFMRQFEPDKFLDAVSDFHVLLYLISCDMLPLKDHMSRLLEAVKAKDADVAHHWTKTEEWGTVEQLMSAYTPSPPASRQSSHSQYTGSNPDPLPPIDGGGAGAGPMWTCSHCTFLNPMDTSSCEMCSLPK